MSGSAKRHRCKRTVGQSDWWLAWLEDVIEEHADLGAQSQEIREFRLVHVLRNIYDSRIPLQGARFPLDAPRHADVYSLLFPAPLQFNATQIEIRFDARYLALPMRRDEK